MIDPTPPPVEHPGSPQKTPGNLTAHLYLHQTGLPSIGKPAPGSKRSPTVHAGQVNDAEALSAKKQRSALQGLTIPDGPHLGSQVSPTVQFAAPSKSPAPSGWNQSQAGFDFDGQLIPAFGGSLIAANAAAPAEATYLGLIQTLKKYPDTQDFVYLRRLGKKSPEYNPYALEVVAYADADKDELYTLSAKGVTQYYGGTASEFTSLDQWERELHLFARLKRLTMFRLYKLWKNFRLWRYTIQAAKVARARAALAKNLFLLSPVFQGPLGEVRTLCSELSSFRLQQLQRGQAYALPEFAAAQEEGCQRAKAHLQDFGAAAVEAVVEACKSALFALDARLSEFSSKQEETTNQQHHTMKSTRSATAKFDFGKHDDKASEFAYTIGAARRSEARRLQNYVKMSDYMICDTLHEVLVHSIRDLLAATSAAADLPIPTLPTPPSIDKIKQSIGRPADVNRSSSGVPTRRGSIGDATRLLLRKNSIEAAAGLLIRRNSIGREGSIVEPALSPCVFEVELLLTEDEQDLEFRPSAMDYQACLEALLASWMGVLGSMERLWDDSAVREVVAEGGEEHEAVTPLADLIDGDDQRELVGKLRESLEDAFARCDKYKEEFYGFRDTRNRNAHTNVAAMVAAYQLTKPDIRIGGSEEQDASAPPPEVSAQLPQAAAALYSAFISQVHEATSRLSAKSLSVEEYVEKLKFLDALKAHEAGLEERMSEVQALYELITEYGFKVPEMDLASYHTLLPDVTALHIATDEVEATKDEQVQKFGLELDAGSEAIKVAVKEICNELHAELVLSEATEADSAISYLQDLATRMAAQRAEADRIALHQRMFKVAETQNADLLQASEELDLRLQLWIANKEWEDVAEAWDATPFTLLNMTELEETLTTYHKLVQKLERNLPPNKVVMLLRDKLDTRRGALPVLQALHNSALKERHWRKIQDAVGNAIARDNAFTVQQLLELNVVSFKEEIAGTSMEATQEAALEALLEGINAKWAHVEFAVVPYKDSKDTFVLGGTGEVQAALEDSMVTMTTILSSKYVGGVREAVEKVDSQLHLFAQTLDEWLACQKSWMYLECIFTAPDIQRQLPHEAKAFAQVDRQFRDTMRRTSDRANALQAGTASGLLDVLHRNNEVLEKISKNLEDYLEIKRMAFPRFYFLSNDELLDILAQSKNAQAVQPHIGKCFEGIKRLDFGEDPKSIDIFAMVSGEGERVNLGKNLKARGNVEAWLGQVELSMTQSLRRLARAGYQSYSSQERTEWVLQQPAQLVLILCQIFWCQGVERCLAEKDTAAALAAYLKHNITQLSGLTRLVRGKLDPLHRRSLAALLTIDVHARDIVEQLLSDKVDDANAFAWQMQLRYTWSETADDVVIRQVNARFLYGYEYLGPQPRLVMTPMTDRCYMTLTGALHLKLGGAPAGPAGTGKTETTKDLGKALGVNCVVFNCGENLDYRFMGKFFAGLAQCGAWACFDEFNRIDIEVLSVVAQQLLTIQNALKSELPKFNFEGRTIRIVPTCGVFITMNPGYAGRTELPDNLKALFRPMAMMIPDYALVAEVMLFSEGFEDSKALARKMVKLYKLCSEQLSQQDHYDFGMRAVKSVLVMAGILKRSDQRLPEDVVLIQAMRDSNLPKLLADDQELFQNIISDLFPGVSAPLQDNGELDVCVKTVLAERGLQAPASFVSKVLQLYETLKVRFGVMLVGPTGGGKTTCYRTLQGAVTRMRQVINHPDELYQVTQCYAINPKCVKMGELYGEYSPLNNEWHDGLGSTFIRAAVADTTNDKKWVVFDGPVDAVWIENMNTVLDDNCTLCLPNGERIKLNPATMRMIFEVADLAVASPATVSRCGMVYVTPEELGWMPYVTTWLEQKLPTEMCVEVKEYIMQLFEEYVDKGLRWVRSQTAAEYIPTVDNSLVASLAHLLQALLTPERGFDMARKPEQQQTSVARVFVFAFVWALGGNLISSTHAAFDAFARDLFGNLFSLPAAGRLYDYYVDLKSPRGADLRNWADAVPAFQYDRSKPYFQMLVPTIDTARFSFLLEVCLDVQRSVLLSGMTGVGKSVITIDALEGLRARKGVLPYTINFSAQTQALDTQLFIESKLEKKRRTKLGAPAGKRIVFYVDDVNMPARETFGSQPPIELLRQFQDYKGFYDREKLFWKDIEDTTLVAACAPPGGGRQPVSARFMRHFTQLCVPPPSDAITKSILSTILGGFLADFPPDFRSLCGPLVTCSVEAYNRISEELLPSPAKSHYTFNLRDLSKVFQGILMIKPDKCADKETMVRLWAHESLRVFHDRLISAEDKGYFRNMLSSLVAAHMGNVVKQQDLFGGKTIMFGDFLRIGMEREGRAYEEVTDVGKLQKLLDTYLDEYNSATTNPMNLVFFMDAVEHITRIARILRQPRGNAMLVGVSGSGKQSLTRFAASMGGFKCLQLELKRNYASPEFREDLKKLYHTAGIEGTAVVFLLTDTQIVDESFLEDINNMLNSGEVPGMYGQDEKDRIVASMREVVEEQGITPTKDACYAAFINRVRDNLHCVLAMSPVGDAFRARCRRFPSLINCCTIDWFTEWPPAALASVSQKFLAPVDLGTDAIKAALATMCVDIHTSVAAASERFYAELRRRYYTTPKSYLDLINLYIGLLRDKRRECGEARDRLLNGLNKLQETNALVDKMQAELSILQPVLEEKSQATAVLLKQVAQDQEAAEQVRRVVSAEEQEVKAKAAETQALADDAKADLDEALPALQAAVDSLNALNKQDIIEIKSMVKPPPLVQMSMEAVCVLKQEKADWDTAKRILGESSFMKSLLEFDKDNIPDAVIKKLKKYTDNPEYTVESVAKQSRAAMSLCMWTRAMETYNRISRVVEPKRAALREAEAALLDANTKLHEKQAALQAVVDKVARLEQQLAEAQKEQAELKLQADTTEKRLVRAAKLTSGLAEEGVRWGQTAERIQVSTNLLVGDVFIGAACIAYYGAFTGQYRQDLVAAWIARCRQLGIPVSGDCTLKATLASPVEVREWHIFGLPIDDVSIDNGILVTRGKRWPLMIDPQGQAAAWVKAMEAKNGLRIVKLTNANFLRTLENSIRIGNPVLIEDVEETLDPALEPVLLKQVYKQAGRTLIRLGDTDIDYEPNFRLYITSKLANPHYLPEVCIKVTLINFTVTSRGLEDQLLGDVVRKERPDLEEQRDRLVLSISSDKRQLKELEDKILKLLKEAKGNILDDEVLINTLNNSKLTSGMIQGRVKEAEETEVNINEAREHYRPAAARGSTLYFGIADLAVMNPMYQNSLAYFTRMFNFCIDASERAAELPARLRLLCDFVTRFIFHNVQRGLFEEHKLLFSFLTGTAIARSSGDIAPAEWNLLLRGASGAGRDTTKPRPPQLAAWVTPAIWANLAFLDSTMHAFEGITESVASNERAWRAWWADPEPHAVPFPAGWSARLTRFQRLLLVKVLREEKLQFACQRYIEDTLGKAFTEPAPWNLDDIFPDTNARTPVIFILSSGADPTSMLQRFAEKHGMVPGETLHMISLGQGQGPVAETMVTQAIKNGHWVCLQNCHLAKSWMLRLEALVEEITKGSEPIHPDFRLWLTSMPSPVFPVLVLQNGIKVTNEPPRGVKANVQRTYNNMTARPFESCASKPAAWKKLLFSLSFFHAVVQERGKFGALGWNEQYAFSQSDLECSMMNLLIFLSEQDTIPWTAMEHVIGHINYGGRVTDDMDRRCLMSILRKYITPRVLHDAYRFTPSGKYYSPEIGPIESYRDFLRTLPATEAPEVFGMHANANIAFELQETRRLIDTILSIQPRLEGGHGGSSGDQVVADLAGKILQSLPANLNREDAHPELFDRTPAGQLNSLSVVLSQEMHRLNRLTNTMRTSLVELQKAITGLVVMSSELELMYNSFLNNQVPELWAAVAYPSLKALGAWVEDYQRRSAFLRSWLTGGSPATFWLSGLFFPQGFMTAVLQMHARKYAIPIDRLGMQVEVTQHMTAEDVSTAPEDGVYIDGLWLDGARWNAAQGCLDESEPGVMFSPLPVVHFKPTPDYAAPATTYECPLYKTSVRAGALSTTGQSTNFVLCLNLPMRKGTDTDHWVLQGVACLCMLDD
ncbi:hypothetical protein WJX72_003121 [[Myrmecia] bisecta]|uniref:Dynein heavy chain n=1 Tax=[Myrmecia] bisecta TaxID=41462 RepID=A0AAW1QQT0_9CHLO